MLTNMIRKQKYLVDEFEATLSEVYINVEDWAQKLSEELTYRSDI